MGKHTPVLWHVHALSSPPWLLERTWLACSKQRKRHWACCGLLKPQSPTPSNTPLLTRPYLPILPQLETKHSYMWVWPFSFKPSHPASTLSFSIYFHESSMGFKSRSYPFLLKLPPWLPFIHRTKKNQYLHSQSTILWWIFLVNLITSMINYMIGHAYARFFFLLNLNHLKWEHPLLFQIFELGRLSFNLGQAFGWQPM